MPTHDAAEPVEATVTLGLGDLRIVASDRRDVVVDVVATDPSHEQDVRAARQTVVDHEAGRLRIAGPKQRGLGLFTKPGSIDVTVQLPTGSSIDIDTSVAGVRCDGRLAHARIATSVGTVVVEHVAGDADIKTGSGTVRVGTIEGNAVVKNSNGDIEIDAVFGSLRTKNANGDITVGRSASDVTAATANGDVTIDEISSGAAALDTAYGRIDFGIAHGTAARLDLSTTFGTVVNDLDASTAPTGTDRTAVIHAHTGYGDVIVRRSPLPRSIDNKEAP